MYFFHYCIYVLILAFLTPNCGISFLFKLGHFGIRNIFAYTIKSNFEKTETVTFCTVLRKGLLVFN